MKETFGQGLLDVCVHSQPAVCRPPAFNLWNLAALQGSFKVGRFQVQSPARRGVNDNGGRNHVPAENRWKRFC